MIPIYFFFSLHSDHLALHVLTRFVPTRRSAVRNFLGVPLADPFELCPGQNLCDTGRPSGNPLQDVSGLELAAPAFVENDLAKNSDLIVFVDRMDIVELTDGLDCLVVEFDFKDAHSAVGRIVNDFLDLAFKSGLVDRKSTRMNSNN